MSDTAHPDDHSDPLVTVMRSLSVDACIADEVQILNARGIRTIMSCCDHDMINLMSPTWHDFR